jgi:hypothetical protein
VIGKEPHAGVVVGYLFFVPGGFLGLSISRFYRTAGYGVKKVSVAREFL